MVSQNFNLKMQSWANLILFVGVLILTSCKSSNTINLTRDDNRLLDIIQKQSLDYIWKGEEPISGGARERIHMDNIYPENDQDVITSGGTGFGVMAIITGIDRKLINKDSAIQRLEKLTNWLEKADRFYGAWPHWLKPSGKTVPFSPHDDGGDIVETAYLAAGLITAREYFKNGNKREKSLSVKMDQLWKEINWNHYTRGGQNVIYWHWSPKHEWKMNFAIRGYNECLILYILAASSPSFSVDPKTYHEGFMRSGAVVSDRKLYDIPTIVDHFETNDIAVGPLFWAHYTHLGIDPRGLKDKYADWWKVNENHAKINHVHSVINPYDYKGYSDECWGLTASYSLEFYAAHNPQEDLGVISPTAALSSFPYTPIESMKFLKWLYHKNPHLIGKYGPYDAFSLQSDWFTPRYLAIDQLTIPVMIENYRSGLIWKLMMNAPEIKGGLKKLGFSSPYLK
jgi:hypothetical protein